MNVSYGIQKGTCTVTYSQWIFFISSFCVIERNCCVSSRSGSGPSRKVPWHRKIVKTFSKKDKDKMQQ
jgi:hypothetical protein